MLTICYATALAILRNSGHDTDGMEAGALIALLGDLVVTPLVVGMIVL